MERREDGFVRRNRARPSLPIAIGDAKKPSTGSVSPRALSRNPRLLLLFDSRYSSWPLHLRSPFLDGPPLSPFLISSWWVPPSCSSRTGTLREEWACARCRGGHEASNRVVDEDRGAEVRGGECVRSVSLLDFVNFLAVASRLHFMVIGWELIGCFLNSNPLEW